MKGHAAAQCCPTCGRRLPKPWDGTYKPEYVDRERAGSRRPITEVEAPLAEAVRTGEMVLIESLQARESRYPRLASLHSVNDSQALAAVPLIVEGRTVGAMGLTFKEAQRFEADDRAFMLSIARQCAQIHTALFQTYIGYPIESALPA